MAILRYTASADNTITNAFDESMEISNRATGSNMGKSDVLEVFSIYGQASSSSGLSSELSRALVKFDVSQLNADRTAKKLPAQGSVNFYLKLYNTPHAASTAEDYKLTIARVTSDWQEGYGLDLDNYADKTYDGIGSNWVRANTTDAKATGKVTVLNEGFIENNDTITLIATDGTQVVATATATTTTSTAATTAVQFAHNGASPSAQATLIATAINYSSYFSAAADGADVNITQSVAGYGGNSTITCVDGGGAGPWFSKTDFTGGSGEWDSFGGDFSTAADNFVDVTMTKGTEDVEVDVTTIVENWLGGSPTNSNYGFMIKLSSSYEAYSTAAESSTASNNTTGAKRSYYTKKFFGRGTEYFFKRPTIEARWDDSVKDDRSNIYLSSSLASAADNLNTIYMHNYVRGNLVDIGDGSDSNVPSVKFYYASSSTPEGHPRTVIVSNSNVTSTNATRVSEGLYKVSFAVKKDQFPEGYPYLVDVWSYGGEEVHTGSAMLPKPLNFSNSNPSSQYVVSVSNLRNYYNNAETARFRVFMRQKGWSPTVHTIASNKVETLMVPSASYEIYRVIDDAIVIPYGTGSSPSHTMLSHDVSGNYFDLDMSMLEGGYSYGIRIAIYESSIGSWREQPYTFKFKVNKYEY